MISCLGVVSAKPTKFSLAGNKYSFFPPVVGGCVESAVELLSGCNLGVG